MMIRFLKKLSRRVEYLEKRQFRRQVAKANVWFIDIPRTGSTSIKSALSIKYGPAFDKKFHRQSDRKKKASPFKGAPYLDAHVPASQVRKMLGDTVYDGLFTFTFVRHPLDRFFSLFNYRVLVGDLSRDLKFKDYAKHLQKVSTRHPDSPFYKSPYFLTMSDYILNEKDEPLVSKIYKFENREPAINEIEQETGCSFTGKHYEKSEGRENYFDQYDRETAEVVQDFFAEDFKNFNYPKWPG
ncbi:MAG: sulfotransferase family protein [Opitutales bacterium]|nr:sulfotransferase family protein [Opitutales bacterium]